MLLVVSFLPLFLRQQWLQSENGVLSLSSIAFFFQVGIISLYCTVSCVVQPAASFRLCVVALAPGESWSPGHSFGLDSRRNESFVICEKKGGEVRVGGGGGGGW